MNAPLHEAVRRARKERGLTQAALGRLAGVQSKQISTLEQGGNVTLNTLKKILTHLPDLDAFTFNRANATCQTHDEKPAGVAGEAAVFARALEVLAGAFVAASAKARE